MNPEIFTHYGTRLRTKSKRVYIKSLKAIPVSKIALIDTVQITTHYAKEIRLQAKVFKNNINQINRFDYEKNYYYSYYMY